MLYIYHRQGDYVVSLEAKGSFYVLKTEPFASELTMYSEAFVISGKEIMYSVAFVISGKVDYVFSSVCYLQEGDYVFRGVCYLRESRLCIQ